MRDTTTATTTYNIQHTREISQSGGMPDTTWLEYIPADSILSTAMHNRNKDEQNQKKKKTSLFPFGRVMKELHVEEWENPHAYSIQFNQNSSIINLEKA